MLCPGISDLFQAKGNFLNEKETLRRLLLAGVPLILSSQLRILRF